MDEKQDEREEPSIRELVDLTSSKRVIKYKPGKVELRKAENRWVRFIFQDIPEEERKMQELFRKFQAILNKLTPQKFSDLATKALQLDISTEEKLQGCIDKIFEKALEEPNFSIVYANLSRVLSNIKVQVSRPAEDVKETSFRRELLTKCQKEFEKNKKDDMTREIHAKAIQEATTEEERQLKQAEFDQWESIARRRSLGNIRFIGELFKLKMLSEGIMHDCIQRLLRSTSDHESLECFCRLITTTGKELDHEKAKERMDRYFDRVSQIIEKKKISSRIKFMLQDVQDLRDNDWVPRRQEGLKTIDQIHHEAKMEEMAEQAMIKNITINPNKTYSRDDKKKGSKQDDMSARRFEKKPDVTKILNLHKKPEGTTGTSSSSGASLCPGGWNKRKDGQTPPPGDKEKPMPSKSAPTKSNTGNARRQTPTGGSGRPPIIMHGPRKSSSTPSEKMSVIETLKEMTSQPQQQPVIAVKDDKNTDKFDEETIRRKTCTIVDELTENRDFTEAVECVTELDSPSHMNVFVSECVLHSLEKSSNHRKYAGELLEHLYIKNTILTKDNIDLGFKEVIDLVEDLEVDITKIWDFFAEIICPLFLCQCLSLKEYVDILNDADLSHKAPKGVARLLHQCSIRRSKETAIELWSKSSLSWSSIGLDYEESEFIDRENLQFLSVSAATSSVDDPPYFKDLVVMFGRSDTPNDEILSWIELQKIDKDSVFIRSLSRACVLSNTQGKGDSCIFQDEKFRSRLPVLKRWVDENEDFQMEVLNTMQVCVERLEHPSNMLSGIFWSLYDVEVISEKSCCKWKHKCNASVGSGMAIQTTKQFFDWVESADQEESDDDSNNSSIYLLKISESRKRTQEVLREFQMILRDLTLQKFSDSAVKALQLEINTNEKVQGCVDMIFLKVSAEPHVIIPCAYLCKGLSDNKVHITTGVSFKEELLMKCQKELMIYDNIMSAANVLDKWEKTQLLFSIRFTGELFRLQILPESIMHDCIQRLLRSTSDHESLECFCRLITTTGKILDHERDKKHMDGYFDRVSQIIKQDHISSRIKFMLQDVIELRKCHWAEQELLNRVDLR